MKPIIQYFAENQRITFFLTGFVVLGGLLGFANLGRESFPPVDFATATITTVYPGASPEEVEDGVTLKIEDELKSVDGIKDIRSVSQPGLSDIVIRIEQRGDQDRIMDDIQRAVQRVTDLPVGVKDKPRFVRRNTGEIPILEMALVGDVGGRARDELAEDLQDLLDTVSGVADVRLSGYRERQYQVLLDQRKLASLTVSLNEVNAALARQLRDLPGGYIRDSEWETLVRVKGKTRDRELISNLIIRSAVSGVAVRIGDVARVVDASEDAAVLARVNGEPATLIVVSKKSDADTITVVDSLRPLIEGFEKRLPAGLKLKIYNNEELRVQNRLNIVVTNALMGLAFILVVLLVLLPGTIGIVSSLSVPLIIFSLTAGMALLGFTFNTITMIASVIVLGMLVDNSAVVAENYARLRSQGLDQLSASVTAAHQFFIPILATVATNLAGFAPMLVTSGIMGAFIFAIPVVVSIALAFSLVETFFLFPARLKYTLRKQPPPPSEEDSFETNWFGTLQRGFFRIMRLLLRRRYLTALGITAFLASALFVSVKLNRFELFPKDQVEIYVIRFEAPIGTTLDRTDRLAAEFSRKVVAFLDERKITYKAVVTRSGVSRTQANDPQGKDGPYVGFILVSLPQEQAVLLGTKEMLTGFRTIRQEGFAAITAEALAGGPPVGRPLSATFKSNSDDEVEAAIRDFKEQIQAIPGVLELEDDRIRSGQELSLDVNTDLVRRVGMTLEEVGAAIRSAVQGTTVSILNDKGREIDVVVRYRPEDRSDLDTIQRLTLGTMNGNNIPLGTLLSAEPREGPTVKKRYNFLRAVTVTANVNPEQISSIRLNAQARKIYADIAARYPNTRITFGGEEESTKESLTSLRNAMIISLVAILGILLLVYNSFGRSFLVLSTIPLGLAGISYIFWLAGRPLGFMALIGVIGLGGVVINASIVMVSFIDDRRKLTPDAPLLQVVAEVAALRFKAVFITNITTIIGLIPTAYGFGGDDPLLIPLTLAMGWGLLVGSVLAIIWVPCGYLMLEDLRGVFRRRKNNVPAAANVASPELVNV